MCSSQSVCHFELLECTCVPVQCFFIDVLHYPRENQEQEVINRCSVFWLSMYMYIFMQIYPLGCCLELTVLLRLLRSVMLLNSQIALTHTNLLKQWRDRAVSGQTEARRVLAEMLTPSGGARSNCYKFISWVTGCSHSTIGRVNEQMKETGRCA